ncbi:MAG: hypothetical protein K6B17_01040 [Treponema sp.]|nr:hypothetical protein [Treponema sp.]
MPGLKQLQQLNSDLLTLGDEVKIRGARGEKPVIVKIPNTVKDINDADDFLNGLPEISEAELQQAAAAKAEREQQENEFADFMNGDDSSSDDTPSDAPVAKKEAVPDVSDLLISEGDMDLDDLDLSDFEGEPEPEPEPEPEEISIEDMDLSSLLAMPDKEEEPDTFVPDADTFGTSEKQAEETVDVSADSFLSDAPAADLAEAEPVEELAEPSPASFDSSLFDMPEENPAEAEVLPEVNVENLASSLPNVGELNEVEAEPLTAEDIPPVSELGGESFDLEAPAEEIAEPVEAAEEPAAEVEAPVENSIEQTEELPDLGDLSFDEPASVSSETLDIADTSDSGDFDPASINLDDIGDIPSLDETPATDDLGDLSLDETLAENSDASDIPADVSDIPLDTEPAVSDSADNSDTSVDGDFDISSLNIDDIDAPASTDDGLGDLGDLNFDEASSADTDSNSDTTTSNDAETDSALEAFDAINEDFESSDSLSMNDDLPTEFNEIPDVGNMPVEEKAEENPSEELSMDMALPDMDENSSAGGDDLSFDLPDMDDSSDSASSSDDMGDFNLDSLNLDSEQGEMPSPEDSVPEETFDTSAIQDLDFSNEENTDFALGEVNGSEDDDEFYIAGFSDTVTADLSQKPQVDTPDFSKAADASDADKPKNTFTDAEYKRFLANLQEYPLNVRIALEDFVVKNEFTDDAIFAVLEKVLRKAPARQVATELEKLLDISIDVPRDFERRSASEYEQYKKSMEYQLKNRIIPGAILTTAAAIMVFCIYTLVNTFIYKPICAWRLYKEGYALLQDSHYPQSEECFNEALRYNVVKDWFYKYAEGYRDHKQYDRSRMMYRAILQRFDNEKQAGLDWAEMERNDLQNYPEAERILKREVLDYHINDADGITALGDTYLDWADDIDPSKYALAKEQYDLLVQLYGDEDKYVSRQMIYYIRTDDLRQVLSYKDYFMKRGEKNGLTARDKIELSGYLLDKRYGKLRTSEEPLRSSIEDIRKLLEDAIKADSNNPVALYNMGRYFVATKNRVPAQKLLEASLDNFKKQTRRNKKDTYKYINTYRLLGEELAAQKEYITAEELYGKGLKLFEAERESSGFESDENVGRMYADLADLDFYIACDNDAALVNYENAVNNKCDTSSVRYKIGYIQYQNQNYPAALGSFIKSYDSNSSDTHLLLALANTLSKNNDNYVAKGYYERLINVLNANKQKYHIVLPQVREDQADLVDTYMKATNNLGVTLHRIANNNGDSSLNATAIVNLQESLRSWDALTRNQITMVRLEGSNLAEQNIKYMTHPTLQYEPELYTEIPRKLENEKGLGL